MKVIVYTTNLNGYDELHNAPKDKGAEYLYYTDGEAPDGWKKMPMDSGDKKYSRYYKINSHLLPPHDISIYIDACYEIKAPLSQLALFLGDEDIAFCKHQSDDCVYKHARRVIQLKLDDKKIVNKQMQKYMQQYMPQNLGLTENCLIIRRNTAKVEALNKAWWAEYTKKQNSHRDQLSLPYILWKTQTKVHILPFSARKNRWLKNWARHKVLRQWQT